MADIAPVRPLRYATTDLSSVVAPPYDVISAADRLELMARSPHNVVRLILPEGEGDAKYAKAAALLNDWKKSGVLIRDEKPAFYRYDQSFEPPGGGAKITRRGFLALVRLVPFSDRVVLPHERTLSGPKEDRLKLFRATGTNLSPGFMLYRDPKRALDAALDTGEVIGRFIAPAGIENVLAKVSAPDAVKAIVDHMKNSSLLIADGHHRYETALNYSGEVDHTTRPAGKPFAERPEHRHFMVFLCNGDDPNLVVFATHRLVHSLPTFEWEGFLKKAAGLFEVIAVEGEMPAMRKRLAQLGRDRTAFLAVSAGGKKAFLALRRDADLSRHPTLSSRPEVVRKTDVAILHSGLLEHELGISLDAQIKKTNLTYLQDPAQGVRDLERGAGQVLFVMNPTPVAQVREVAEVGEVMPQKSTYFYPKILTGLAIHTLDPHRSV
jgi:uncharacterized protein (DUF1015 family)